jgi:hypothetical protein
MTYQEQFLVISKAGVSEWKNDFVSVQIEMDSLEKQGKVRGVTVQQFINNKLQKEFTYDYDGQDWNKR